MTSCEDPAVGAGAEELNDSASALAGRVHPPLRDEGLSTLETLRRLCDGAALPFVHYAEWYHPLASDDPNCCKGLDYEYRYPTWGGSDVLAIPREGPHDACECMDGNDMAFAAAASWAMPLLLDLYQAALNALPDTRTGATPIEIALEKLDRLWEGL